MFKIGAVIIILFSYNVIYCYQNKKIYKRVLFDNERERNK
jgi:hypothetical protein